MVGYHGNRKGEGGEEADKPTSQKLTGHPQKENTEIKHAWCYTWIFFYGVPVVPFARYGQKIAMKSGENISK